MGTLININAGSESDFTQFYERPIEVPEESEIALMASTFWYSWHNISEKYNNNVIKVTFDKNLYTIKFPNGLYDVSDIQDYINDYFETKDPPIRFVLNYVTQKVELKIKKGVKLELDSSDFNKLIGFKPMNIENFSADKDSVIISGTEKPDITRGIEHIHIHCSIVENSKFNSKDNDVIAVKSVNVNKGEQINIEPNHLFFIPLKNNMTEIREIRMRITDQDDRLIDFNDEKINYTLAIQFPKK